MPVTIPTTEETKDQIVKDIESKINQTVPLLPKAVTRVFASALAGIFTLAYKFGLWIYNQIFPQTSDYPALLLQGERLDVELKGATQAQLAAEDTGVDSTIIPAGTQYVSDNQVVYITQADAAVASGIAVLSLLALTSGEIGNLANGSTLNIVKPIANIDGVATITSTTIEGEDAESRENYRERVIERYQKRPQGGALIDYIIWAKEIAGITRTFVERPTPSFVNVYPVQDNDPGGRIPSPAKLEEVRAYIAEPSRKPLMALPFAIAMAERLFTVEISNLVPDNAEVRSKIDDNIENFLFAMQPQQFEDEQNLKNIVSESILISIAIESGAQSLDLVLKIDVTPIIFYELLINELALLDQVIYL